MNQSKLSFYQELNVEFKKILEWSNVRYPRQTKENFDIDESFYVIQKKYNIEDINDIGLGWLYAFIDAFTDSVRHEFEEIGEDYSVEEAKIDLKWIIDLIEQEKIKALEENTTIADKVNKCILGL